MSEKIQPASEKLQEKVLRTESTAVAEKLSRTSAEVAKSAQEVMTGVESPRESAEENTEAGQAGAVSSAASSPTPVVSQDSLLEQEIAQLNETQLRSRIRNKYEAEIKKLERKAFWVGLLPARFAEDKLNELVAQMRELKRKIAELVDMTLEALRDLYRKLMAKKA